MIKGIIAELKKKKKKTLNQFLVAAFDGRVHVSVA